MRIAHLILAHNNPQQLEVLVRRLIYADDMVFIHLDKKTDAAPFEHIGNLPNVFFIKERAKVGWGAYSIVEATLNGFREILASPFNIDVVNLLSGCDYPLQNPATVHNFLQANPGKIFMEFELMRTNWQEALSRVERYHLTNYNFKGRYLLQSIMNRLLPKRRMPNRMTPVGRSQWFTAPAECIKYMVDYIDQNKAFKRFIEHTWAPDEFVFQTILYNSKYREQMVNDNLRCIDWSERNPSPKTYTIADKSVLLCSDKLFARKFDLTNHADVIQAIDARLDDNNEGNSAVISA
ncbi:beta-1,6-N-acetylglucosaminyltransferase [Mucilaginibacter terrae]|nr:beta-1,6-N-acetylglucosaminyltransferase [Mucilaginibacter terrae]